MIKIGIAGATGYVGIELIRILSQHSEVKIAIAASHSHAGQSLHEVYPHLRNLIDISLLPLDTDMTSCDLVFLALPSGHAKALAAPILAAGKKVIDLSPDFRLTDLYGLTELNRHKIPAANFIANPGCYPTACALAALPALAANIVKTEDMIFDAKSGLSGAGRGLSLHLHYCEAAENFKAYHIAGTHRHTPEIEKTLSEIAGHPVTVSFTPHLIPQARGLLVTSYLPLNKSYSSEKVWEIYHQAYKDEAFVRLYPLGELPQTANVKGSNYCDIGLQIDPRTNKLIVISVIDNLVKGAAGQAVQNMNVMYGFPETKGLELCPI